MERREGRERGLRCLDERDRPHKKRISRRAKGAPWSTRRIGLVRLDVRVCRARDSISRRAKRVTLERRPNILLEDPCKDLLPTKPPPPVMPLGNNP